MARMNRFLLSALLLSSALGCDPAAAPPPGKPVIAVIPKGTTHEFWKSIHAGAVKASRELGVEIVWKGPVKEDNRADQIKEVENFITRKVAGIVLAPLDDEALVRPVSEAVKAGIPVVIIDSDLKSKDPVSFVATDNYKGGRMGGERLAALLGGKGKVILLRYQEGSASTMNREKGFLDAIAEHKGIEVVSSNRYAGATAGSAQKESENLLAPHVTADGLKVDGIFCPNESSTVGMLEALKKGKLAGRVKFVGFDASEPLVQGMKDGHLHGLVLQDPMNMGYLGVRTMVAHLRKEKFEEKIDTGAKLVTPENLSQPEFKELLHPDLDRWLK
jgi:ribose transport system substrate-binding protein